MELYWHMPVRLQEAILSLYASYLEKIYYGSVYQEWKEWLSDWKTWHPSYVEDWKNERLKCIVELAARRVPYYHESFKGRDWKKVRSEADLHLLPLLDKQSIRQNENAFIVDNINPKSLWVERTSGTTGTALNIYMSKSMIQQYWAIMEIMIRKVAGVAQEMPRAMTGSRPIKRGDDNQPPYWRYNRRWKQLYFSSYHISKKTAPEYIKALRKYGSKWIAGFGSAIAALAENALEAGIVSYPLISVTVSGDTLLPNMRTSIEKFFQCKCFDNYGQTEKAAMAMECIHRRIHLIPVTGIIEILREDGTPCMKGEVGEIVVTGLLNDTMPLIRYRIGDHAAWAEDQECLCGNPNPIITNLEGRVDDYLITSDGKKIGRLAAFRRSPTIHSAQLVQDSPGHAYLLVRPGKGYRSQHSAAVCDDILERVGKFTLEVIEVAEIPKTEQGKTVTVVRLEERPSMRNIYEKLIEKSIHQ
jgi:phenylacetate-CoA ligase